MNKIQKPEFKLVSHQDNQHYDDLIWKGIAEAKRSVLIATANVKNVMVKKLKRYFSIIDTFARLCQRGVDIKILYASKPSGPFLKSMHKHPELEQEHFDMRLCARNHMKLLSIDNEVMYLGSANLTGAGIGLRSKDKHNFEMGLITRDTAMIKKASGIFMDIWTGRQCRGCSFKKKMCRLPIEKIE